jgi:hypothetical protein
LQTAEAEAVPARLAASPLQAGPEAEAATLRQQALTPPEAPALQAATPEVRRREVRRRYPFGAEAEAEAPAPRAGTHLPDPVTEAPASLMTIPAFLPITEAEAEAGALTRPALLAELAEAPPGPLALRHPPRLFRIPEAEAPACIQPPLTQVASPPA